MVLRLTVLFFYFFFQIFELVAFCFKKKKVMFDSKYFDLLADSLPTVFSPSLCASCSVTSVQPFSNATRSAASVYPSAKTLWRKEDREDEEEEIGPLGRCLDLNGNIPMLADAARESQESNKAPSASVFQNKSGPVDFELRSQENQQLISQGRAEAGLHTLITNRFCVLSSHHTRPTVIAKLCSPLLAPLHFLQNLYNIFIINAFVYCFKLLFIICSFVSHTSSL